MKIFSHRPRFVALLGAATLFCSVNSNSVAAAETSVPLPEGIEELLHPKTPTIILPGLHSKLMAQPRYALGEPIEVTMRVTYDGDEKLVVDVVDQDRSGRVTAYSFSATDAKGQGVRDPSSQLSGSMGGPSYKGKLSNTQPFEQNVVINQWLAFDAPGIYTIRARSMIVRREGNYQVNPPAVLESEPLQIEIVAPDEKKRLSNLSLAKDVLQIEDREVDQINRQTRLQAVQSLRFMLDVRAIPLLVTALNDGWINVRFEAELGLRSFKDLAPVKTELLRAINDKNTIISPRARQTVLQLLVDVDKQSGVKMTLESVSHYNRMLDEKLAFSLKALPLEQSLETIVEAMGNYQMSRVEAANWNRVLDGAALMSLEAQKKAGELLLNVLTVDPRFDHRLPDDALQKMQNALLKVARDEKVEGVLRSASIVALSRLGDQSQRELLVSEFMKPQPLLWEIDEWGHVWDEAQKSLNGYKTREIAARLLSFLGQPDFFKQDYYAKRSVILRLSDFGGALSTLELAAATKRVIEYSKDDRQSAEMLRALSLKSPDDAIRLIEKLPRGDDANLHFLRTEVITSIVSRMGTRQARSFTERLFRSPDERERVAIINGFALSAQNARERFPSPERGLPIRPDLAVRYFPQILHAFQADTSREVRAMAFYTLDYLTGVPDKRLYELQDADEKKYIPQWQAWWKQNKARSGNKVE